MTTAWWLGEEESHIELDCTSISREIIDKVEEKCNKAIRDGVPVNVKVCEKNDPSLSEVFFFCCSFVLHILLLYFNNCRRTQEDCQMIIQDSFVLYLLMVSMKICAVELMSQI